MQNPAPTAHKPIVGVPNDLSVLISATPTPSSEPTSFQTPSNPTRTIEDPMVTEPYQATHTMPQGTPGSDHLNINDNVQFPMLPTTTTTTAKHSSPTNAARAHLQWLYDQRQTSGRKGYNNKTKNQWIKEQFNKHPTPMDQTQRKRSAGAMDELLTPPRSNQGHSSAGRQPRIVCEPIRTKIPMSKSYDTSSSEDVILQIRTRLTHAEKQDRINIYARVTQLAEKLIASQNVIILPFDPHRNLPFLTQCQHIPRSSEALQHYCATWHINKSNTTLFYQLRVRIQDQPFVQLKKNLFGWLQDHGVYMYTTKLTTSHNCVIGWLLNSHHVLTNRESTAAELKKRCNLMHPIQLVPKPITNDMTHTKTKALAIECGIEDARTVEQALLKGLTEKLIGHQYNSTKNLLYVPMRASPEIPDEIICSCIERQADAIEHTARIKVDNIGHLKQVYGHSLLCLTGKTLREYILDHVQGVSTIDIGVNPNEAYIYIHHCDFHQVLTSTTGTQCATQTG